MVETKWIEDLENVAFNLTCLETLLGAAATTFGLLQTIYRAALLSSSGSMQHYRQAHIQSPIIVELRIKAALIVQLLSGSSSHLNAQLSSSRWKLKEQIVCSFSIQYSFTCSMPACPYLGCTNVVSWKPFSVWFIVRPGLILDCKCGKCQRWYLLIT